MATIYVRTTGNDTTGTGATGAPYLTVHKALTAAVAGDLILIGDGTYVENSGSGSLTVGQAFGSRVTVAPESGRPDRVIIKGTSGAFAVVIGNAQNIHFDHITFEAHANTVSLVIRLTGNATTNLAFTRCTFRAWSASGVTNGCVGSAWTIAASNISNVSFALCKFEQIEHYAATGLSLDNGGAGSTISGIDVQDCTFTSGHYAMRLMGLADVQVLNNRCESWSPLVSATCFQIGVDGETGVATSGIISGNTFRAAQGHGAVVGAGANGVLFVDNRVHGGNNASNGQGVVVKAAQNVRVERNTITSGYLSGLYFKAAVDCQAFENIVYNRHANSAALRVNRNTVDSAANQRLTIRRNYFHATAGTVLNIGTAADDSGGSLVDENVYVTTGAATLGTVRGSTIAKLSELRAAWSGYDKVNNDRNSRLGQTRGTFAGTPLANLPT